MTAPVVAAATGGQVTITCDPDTARDLASAFSTAYATCDELEQERPRWFDDVIGIFTAAARADLQAGRVAEPVNVPLLRPGSPMLRLVGGESA